MRKFLTFLLTALLAFGVGWATEVTVTKTINELATENSWATSFSGEEVCYTNFKLDNNINISTTGSPNCGSVWLTSNTSSTKEWRLYRNKNGNVIVTAGNGCTLKSVNFTYTVTNSGTLTGAPSDTDVSVEGSEVTFTVNNTNSNTNGQVRIRAFSITYETGDEPPVNTPWLTMTPEELTIGEAGDTLFVNGEHMGSGPGVWRVNEGFSDQFEYSLSSGLSYFPLNDGAVTNGEVYVSYFGRELTATGKFGVNSNNTGDGAFSTVIYRPDLYIYCDLVDGQSWRYYPDEPQMTYADGVYTKTVTITNPGSCVMFARDAGLSYGWNDDRRFFGAKWDNDWIYGVDNSKYLALYGSGTNNQYYPIKFNQPGVYTITIDPEAKEFTVTSIGVNTITEAQNFEGDTFGFLGNAVVTYQNGQNLWIRDASGSGLIYGDVGVTFENGDIVAAGWTAGNLKYNHYVPEFINPHGVTKGQGYAAADPIPLTTLDRDLDVNKYASISGVTITGKSTSTPPNYYFVVDGNQYILRDNFSLFTENPLEVGHVYNVVGVVSVYSSAPQLWLTEVEDVTPKELEVTLTSETTTATVGESIPVTVNVENAVGDYTVTYKIGENGTETTLTGNTINVTSQTAGEVTLYVTVTNNGNTVTASKTFTFTEPITGNNVFIKVTSADQLVAGKRYIFVYGNQALGTEATGSFLTPIDVIVTAGDEVKVGDGVAIMTLGGNAGHYTLALGTQYLHAVNSTSLDFGDATEWSIAEGSNAVNDSGFRAKHADYSRAVRKHKSMARFGNYSTNDNNSSFAWLYVEKASTPEPEPMTVALTADPAEESYTVGDVVTVTATVENGSDNTVVTYKIGGGEYEDYPEGGIVLPNTAAGDVVVTVKAKDGNDEVTATQTFHFDAAEAFAITLTATPDKETYTVGDTVNVKVTVAHALVENPTITYTIGDNREAATYDPAKGIDITRATVGDVKLTVNVADGFEHEAPNSKEATYSFVAAPAIQVLLEPAVGTYDVGQEAKVKVTITGTIGEYVTECLINGETETTIDENGFISLPHDNAGTVNLTVTVVDGYDHAEGGTATGTYTFNKKAASLSYGEEPVVKTATVGDGENFDEPELINPNHVAPVTYTSSDTNVATVDQDGNVTIVGAGEAIITAKFAGNNEYLADSASYTINVAKKQLGLAFEPESVEEYVGADVNEPELKNLPADLNATYSSDNTAVATVDPVSGEVTAVAPGTATIKAKFAGNDEYEADSAAYIITVLAKKAAGLSYGEEPVVKTATVGDGENFDEPELINPNHVAPVTYTSSDTNVATVDQDGNVTIVGAGEAIITAKFAGNNEYLADSASYTINVAKKQLGLAFEPESVEEYVGADVNEPELKNLPADLNATYSSDNTAVATVDPVSGEVTAVAPGTATIKAKFAGNDEYEADSATYIITVLAKKAADLSYGEEPVVINAEVGDDIQEPELINPHGLDVSYSSSNTNVATVDQYGNVTIVGEGQAIITAESEATTEYLPGEASYTINVTKKDAGLSFGEDNEFTATFGEDFQEPNLVNPNDLDVTYTSSDTNIATVDDEGNVTILSSGEVTITASFEGNNQYNADDASYTINIAKGDAGLNYVTSEYNIVDGEPFTAQTLVNPNNVSPITYTSSNTAVATVNESTGEVTIVGVGSTTITAEFEGNNQYNPDNAEYTINVSAKPVVATPTFDKASGTWSNTMTVNISCETPGVTIKYSTDEGATWITGTSVSVGEGTTNIKAIAEKDGWTPAEATAYYIVELPAEKPTMEPFDGYFSVKNNGNTHYVNVAGRKTITFVEEANIDKMAGTVVYLKTDNHGQVQSLRSQAADLQGYADRAMKYVPEIVQMAADKLHAEIAGDGILGQNGLDAIMDKFDECFDHHLYVEEAAGGYRLYGKTPSMQHVVDFYRDNQAKVEAKLPRLEEFINTAIEKVLEKTGGRGSSILQPFSLDTIWNRMGGQLTRPVDAESTMEFYRQVLNDKNYVWDFAYQTAMFYWEKVKSNNFYINNKDKMGEFAQYIEKIEDVRPDFKYYVVADGDKIDYISEGNKDVDAARSIWTLNERQTFTVNIESRMTEDNETYYATLYTDFAYNLPEGVTAYKVTKVTKHGNCQLEALTGTVPAQTPILLMATEPGDKVLTLSMSTATAPTDNMLVGADYFINEYQIPTPQVKAVFDLVGDILGDESSFYQELLTKYGHLMLKTSGTVNNKYFWSLTQDDLDNYCMVKNELNEDVCIVRTLDIVDGKLGFYDLESTPANQAFLYSDKFDPVNLLKRDVTRDGKWDVDDVTATIAIVLEIEPEDNNYDYDAADFNGDGKHDVSDVTAMIAYVLSI